MIYVSMDFLEALAVTLTFGLIIRSYSHGKRKGWRTYIYFYAVLYAVVFRFFLIHLLIDPHHTGFVVGISVAALAAVAYGAAKGAWNFKRLLGLVVLVFIALLAARYYPEFAIREQLFIDNPIGSLACSIKRTDFVDPIYGRQYLVKGFMDPISGDGVYFAYVRKNSVGMYYWTGGGSGP